MNISNLSGQSPTMQAFAVFGWNTPYHLGENRGFHPLSDVISTLNLFTFTGVVGVKRWMATERVVKTDLSVFQITSKLRAAMEVTLVLVPLLIIADLVATVVRSCFCTPDSSRSKNGSTNVTSEITEGENMQRLEMVFE